MTEREIFIAVLHEPDPHARAAFLGQACGDDRALRERVEVLLLEKDNLNSFLEQPAAEREVKGAFSLAGEIGLPTGPHEAAGAMIGPYKLLQQIGEGGFGVVFMAEQQRPLRRKVALKLIKPGMDTRQVVARFEAERQALALMDHPNIARVYDGGETAAGRPYFVMELVRGAPVTDFCDQSRLGVRDRLGLFVDVCRAVQHAHQKGIIHRDLKPSNMLVTLHDGVPVIKVIDFGVAKALGQQLTDRTMFTGFVQMIGTPLYMSPEQAELSGLDLDTRCDIYALGVLLYELLTGTTPFDKERLRTAAYDEIRRIIREEEPAKPSTRISTLGQAAATVSTNRQSDAKRLRQLVRGELDWIAMKALEKDRNRRYESASAFAADVQRYLADEPVLACPPTALYRMGKLARRRKRAVGVAALLLVVLLSLGVSTLLRLQRDLARDAQGLAEAAEGEARDLLARAQKAEREVSIRGHLSRAAAVRQRGEVGQRFGCLADLAAALKLDPSPELRAEIRTEATAALALPDLEVAREWKGSPADTGALDFDDSLERYARLDKQGGVAVCRLMAGGETVIARIPAHGRPQFRGPWLSRDGHFVLVASGAASDGEPPMAFRVWRLDGPEPELVLDETAGVSLTALTFSPDSRHLAVGHADQSVNVHDLTTRQRVRRLSLDAVPQSLAFHPDSGDGRLAVAGGSAVRIFDVATGAEHKPLRHPKGSAWMTGLAWHPDGRRLATAYGTQIFLWDAAAATERMAPWESHTTRGIQLAFNHAGDRLVSSDWDAGTRLWDAITGRLLLRTPSYVGLRFSPDDALLGYGVSGGQVRLYRVAPGRELRMIRHPSAEPKELLVYPVLDADGRILAAGAEDLATGAPGRLSFFDFARGEELAVVQLPENTRATPLGYHRRHGWLIGVAETGAREEIAFWPEKVSGTFSSKPSEKVPDTFSGLRIGPPQHLATGWHGGSSLSADGRVLAVPRGNDGAVVLHLDEPGREVSLGPQHDVRFVAVSPDGRWVVTGSHFSDPRSKNARIWDAATGRHVHDLPTDASTAAAFSANGRWLVSSSTDLGCKLWEVETWRERRDFGHAQFALSPDSRLLALNDVHSTIRLAEVETGREVARLTFPEPGWYRPICFSPDGAHLIAADGDRKALYVWDLRAIRRGLTALGLDWDWPAFPPAAGDKPNKSLTVEVVSGDLAPSALTREPRARQAIERHRRAVAAAPDNATACNNLAWAYLTAPAALRDVAAALPLAEKAVRLTPDNAVYRNTLGLAYYRADRFREAVDVLRPNLASQEERGLAFDLYVLAMSHHRLGESDRARDDYDLAVRWVLSHRSLSAGQLDELAAFRAEAEELLGIETKKD